MTAAIFGLVGVIVGGVLNGVVATVQERRRERRAARPAARAVMQELSEIQAILFADAHREPEYRMGAVPAPRAWPDHRMTLAAVVNGETWTAVSGAYEMAEYVIAREEGTVPVRAMYGRAWLPHEISDAIFRAQQQLKPYADLPRDYRPMEPVEEPT
jgi:hypothetical protein